MPGLTSPTSVTTTLSYFNPPEDGGKPYQKVITDPATGDRSLKKNWSGDERTNVVIENVRGREDTVSLDKTGFQYFEHTSKHTSFENDEEIKAEYYTESIELIKKLTGATRVEIFDHSTFLFSLVSSQKPNCNFASHPQAPPRTSAEVSQRPSVSSSRRPIYLRFHRSRAPTPPCR